MAASFFGFDTPYYTGFPKKKPFSFQYCIIHQKTNDVAPKHGYIMAEGGELPVFRRILTYPQTQIVCYKCKYQRNYNQLINNGNNAPRLHQKMGIVQDNNLEVPHFFSYRQAMWCLRICGQYRPNRTPGTKSGFGACVRPARQSRDCLRGRPLRAPPLFAAVRSALGSVLPTVARGASAALRRIPAPPAIPLSA